MSSKNNIMLFLTLLTFSPYFVAAAQINRDYRRKEGNTEASDELSFDTILGPTQSPGCSNRRQFPYGYDYNFYNEGFENVNTATAGPLQWRPVLPIRTDPLPMVTLNPGIPTKPAEIENEGAKVRYLDPALIPKTTKSPEELARLYPSYTILNNSNNPSPPKMTDLRQPKFQSFSTAQTPLPAAMNIPYTNPTVPSPSNPLQAFPSSPIGPPLNPPQLNRPVEELNLYKTLMPNTDIKPPMAISGLETPKTDPGEIDENTKSIVSFLGGDKMPDLGTVEQKDDDIFSSIFQTREPFIQQDLNLDKCVADIVNANNTSNSINTTNLLDEVELTRRFDSNGTDVLRSETDKDEAVDDQDNMRSGVRAKPGAQVAQLSRTMGAINSARVCFACSSLSDPTCWNPTRSTTVKYCRNGNFCVTRRYYAEDEGEAPIVIRDCSRSCDVTLANNLLEDRYEACSICAEDLCNSAKVDNTPSKAHTFNTFNLLPFLCLTGFYKYSF